MPVDSQTIKFWLESRHAGDIYTSEALIGSGGSQRFDFWAMEPTWTKTHCTGYEVKVSRRDFVQDKKWRIYLDYCSEFYFVCPHGLISPDELPKEAGLIYCPKEGGHLYTKKKAPQRGIKDENLNIMLRHVLMWRHRVNAGHGKDKAESWLREMSSNRELDYSLKQAIRKAAGEHTKKVKESNRILKEENQSLSLMKEWAAEFGLDLEDGQYGIRQRLEEMKTGLTPMLTDVLRESKHLMRNLKDLIEKMEPGAKED